MNYKERYNKIVDELIEKSFSGLKNEEIKMRAQNIQNSKFYKYMLLIPISSFWTVTIFPGDLVVAGCFLFLIIFGGISNEE